MDPFTGHKGTWLLSTHTGETPGVLPTCWICRSRDRDWAAQARRESRALTHEAATTPYWQLVGPLAPRVGDEVHVWPKGAVLDAKISELLALRAIAKDHAAGITGYIIHPSAFTIERPVQKIEGRFLQARSLEYPRSRVRRALEWAARWLGYYVR